MNFPKTVAILLASLALLGRASTENRFFLPEGLSAYPGENVSMVLRLETDTVLSGYGFSCVMDTTAFEFTLPDSEAFTWDSTAAETGNLDIRLVEYIDSLGSFGGFAFRIAGCDPGVSVGDWIALNVQIHVRDDAVPGTYSFQIPYPSNPCGGSDCDGEDVDFVGYGGQFHVLAHLSLTAPPADTVMENGSSGFEVTAVDELGHDVSLLLHSTDMPMGSYIWSDVAGGDSVTGTFESRPGYCDSGEHTAVFRAECDGGSALEETVSVSVSNSNRAPYAVETDPPCPIGFIVDSVGTVSIRAFDADLEQCMDDSLWIDVSGVSPDSLVDLGDGTALLFWNPAVSDTGSHAVTFQATDIEGANHVQNCTLVVVPAHSVELSMPETETLSEETLSSVEISASDNLGWPILLSLVETTLPPGSFSWEDSTDYGTVAGFLDLSPGFCDSGSYAAVFRASSSAPLLTDEIEDTLQIRVLNSDRAPVIQPLGDMRVKPLDTLSFTVTAADLDLWECSDDFLTLTSWIVPEPAESLPHFVQTTDTSGQFVWIPDSNDTGEYTAGFSVTDLEGLVDTELVAISAQDESLIRGDANADLLIRMSDVVFILQFLYVPGSPEPPCKDAADVLDNGEVSMADGLYMLRALYVPGSPPVPPPHPGCGADPTADTLSCSSHPCQELFRTLTDRDRMRENVDRR